MFRLTRKSKDAAGGAAGAGSTGAAAAAGRRQARSKQQPLTKEASVRSRLLQSELSKLDEDGLLPDTCKLKFENVDNLRTFTLTYSPDSGLWQGGTYVFRFNVPPTYNIEPPKVICETKIWHPNISEEGNVCLNILRKDWTPVLTIQHVAFGICELFEALVNPDDPLNVEAGEQMEKDRAGFERKARDWVRRHAR